MHLNSPAISVVMAAYNAEFHISKAINSLQRQSFSNWELICVDDGSTDNTWGVVSNISAKDERIKLLRQPNSGPALARRSAYLKASGEYVISLDSDDYFAEDTLEVLYLDAKSNSKSIIMADMMRLDDVHGEWTSFSCDRGMVHGQIVTGPDAFLMTFPWVVNGQFLIPLESILENVVEEEFFNAFNSDEYLTRLHCLSANSVFFSRGKYYYSTTQNSLSSSPSMKRLLVIETDRKLLDLALYRDGRSFVIERVHDHVCDGISKFSSLVGYHLADGSLPLIKIGWAFLEVNKSITACLEAKRKVKALDAKHLLRSSRISLNFRSFYFMAREYLARNDLLRSIVRKFTK